jgi:hypothetical protein
MSRVDRPLSVISCRACLQPCRARDRLWTSVEKMGGGTPPRSEYPIVCNPDDQCTRVRDSRKHASEGRCPTGGHRHENIVNVNSVLTDELPHWLCRPQLLPRTAAVRSSSRDQQQSLSLGHPKVGEFGPILHREASRCAGARINEPTSLSQPRLHGIRGGADGGESGPYGCYGRKLSFNHRFQDIRRIPTIYAGVAGAGFFGLHVNSRVLRWCVNQARRHVRWQSCDR